VKYYIFQDISNIHSTYTYIHIYVCKKKCMYEKYMYTYIGIRIRYAGVDTYVHIYIYMLNYVCTRDSSAKPGY
jgi:hypothetical protein